MSDQNGTSTDNKVDSTQETIEKLSETFTEQADIARQKIVSTLRDTAERIRTELEQVDELDEQAKMEAGKVVARMNRVGDYLEQHTTEEISQDADEAIRDNAWRALLVVFVIGLIIGLFFKRD